MAEGGEGKGFAPITTQEELDRVIGPRLKREADKVRAEFADYGELKGKAERLDEIEEANKSALQKSEERAKAAEDELERVRAGIARTNLVARVSQETGVPTSLLHGETEEELRASADAVSAYVKEQAPAYPPDQGGSNPGGAPKPTPEQLNAIKDPVQRLRARVRANEQ